MADKKLNEVTKVTDMAYVPVIMADGSVGQIAKSDLASVVAGLTGINTLKRVDDANTVKTSGDYVLASTASNIPVTQWGTMKVSGDGTNVSQTFHVIASTEVYMRITDYQGLWLEWQRIDNFGYNTLAELSDGVAGQKVYNHTSGNIEDINLKGISLFHFDKDHNPSATDYPFNFGDMIHAQLEGPDGNIYKIMVAVDVTGQIKIGRKWGRTGAMIWKTVSAS